MAHADISYLKHKMNVYWDSSTQIHLQIPATAGTHLVTQQMHDF